MREPNTETKRQLKRVHTLTIAEGHLRPNPETASAKSTQDDQERLATFTAFVCKSTSGFRFLRNGGHSNIRTKEETLTAYSTVVEAELMTAIGVRDRKTSDSPTLTLS